MLPFVFSSPSVPSLRYYALTPSSPKYIFFGCHPRPITRDRPRPTVHSSVVNIYIYLVSPNRSVRTCQLTVLSSLKCTRRSASRVAGRCFPADPQWSSYRYRRRRLWTLIEHSICDRHQLLSTSPVPAAVSRESTTLYPALDYMLAMMSNEQKNAKDIHLAYVVFPRKEIHQPHLTGLSVLKRRARSCFLRHPFTLFDIPQQWRASKIGPCPADLLKPRQPPPTVFLRYRSRTPRLFHISLETRCSLFPGSPSIDSPSLFRVAGRS